MNINWKKASAIVSFVIMLIYFLEVFGLIASLIVGARQFGSYFLHSYKYYDHYFCFAEVNGFLIFLTIFLFLFVTTYLLSLIFKNKGAIFKWLILAMSIILEILLLSFVIYTPGFLYYIYSGETAIEFAYLSGVIAELFTLLAFNTVFLGFKIFDIVIKKKEDKAKKLEDNKVS